MKLIKRFAAKNGKALSLAVVSSIEGTEQLLAITPLWRVLDASGLLGAFELNVRHLIQGEGGGAQVKILGVGNDHTTVFVQFQSSLNSCFDGILAGRNTMGGVITGSIINNTLKEIAGFGWFDPDHPENKKTNSSRPADPLVSVETAMPSGVNALPAPARDKRTKGVSRDSITTQAIFLALAEKADANRQIKSVEITDTIIAVACKSDPNKNRHCAAPMMVAWKKRGWLELVTKRSNVSLFKITDEAVKTFGLVFPSATTPPDASQELAGELPRLGDPNLLTDLKVLKATAEKFQTARATITALRERRKEIQEEIRKLEAFVDDPKAHQAFALWSQISKVIAQTPSPKK